MTYFSKKLSLICTVGFFSLLYFLVFRTEAAGFIDIPLNTWVKRLVPKTGEGPAGGMKHMRLAHNPVNGKIYFEGGDYAGPTGLDSGRTETYSYSIADDTWNLEYPYCGPAGSVQPAGPDQVGWVYDTKRDLFWMTPGYQDLDSSECPGATLIRNKIMTFDPVKRVWTNPESTAPIITGEVTGFAQYDPVTDKIIRFYLDKVQIYDIANDTWTSKAFTVDVNGVKVGLADWGRGTNAAFDRKNRRIYFISPFESRLYRYDVDTQELRFLINTPIDTIATAGPGDRMMPIWDSVNDVLLWPQIFDNSGKGMQFHVYHPDTNKWEVSLPLIQPDGFEVRGNNVVFDPYQNVLLLMGGAGGEPANPYIFLYRYGNGPGGSASGDTVPPNAPLMLKVM